VYEFPLLEIGLFIDSTIVFDAIAHISRNMFFFADIKPTRRSLKSGTPSLVTSTLAISSDSKMTQEATRMNIIACGSGDAVVNTSASAIAVVSNQSGSSKRLKNMDLREISMLINKYLGNRISFHS
jgi:hypothetical protein